MMGRCTLQIGWWSSDITSSAWLGFLGSSNLRGWVGLVGGTYTLSVGGTYTLSHTSFGRNPILRTWRSLKIQGNNA